MGMETGSCSAGLCVCLVNADRSYELVMNARIRRFTQYEWQIHKVCLVLRYDDIVELSLKLCYDGIMLLSIAMLHRIAKAGL